MSRNFLCATIIISILSSSALARENFLTPKERDFTNKAIAEMQLTQIKPIKNVIIILRALYNGAAVPWGLTECITSTATESDTNKKNQFIISQFDIGEYEAVVGPNFKKLPVIGDYEPLISDASNTSIHAPIQVGCPLSTVRQTLIFLSQDGGKKEHLIGVKCDSATGETGKALVSAFYLSGIFSAPPSLCSEIPDLAFDEVILEP